MSGILPTGGPLNYLNEKARTNQRSRSVPVMALVTAHRPKTPEELKALIEYHSTHRCSCGVTSQGTVEKFAENLYKAQRTCREYIEVYGTEHTYDFKACYDFMYTLFCVAPLRGAQQEQKSIELIQAVCKEKFPDVVITPATSTEDFTYGVDYKIQKGDKTIGIQVKPRAYFRNTYSVQLNSEKHKAYGSQVVYHVYSNSSLEFEEESTRKILKALEQL
jgi:hypothetical protein